MVRYGISDVLIAFPIVGRERIERLRRLHQEVAVEKDYLAMQPRY
jgi:D-serine deaminase-like pyridoxal phosphate-dependent protein